MCPVLCIAPVLGTWLRCAQSCLSPGFGVSPASASACAPCSEVKSPSLGWSQRKALEEQSCAFMACQAPQTAGTWGDRVPPAPLATRNSASIGRGAGGLPQIPCQGWAPPPVPSAAGRALQRVTRCFALPPPPPLAGIRRGISCSQTNPGTSVALRVLPPDSSGNPEIALGPAPSCRPRAPSSHRVRGGSRLMWCHRVLRGPPHAAVSPQTWGPRGALEPGGAP